MRATGRVRGPRLSWAAVTLGALCLGSCSSPSPPRETPPAPIVLAGAENLVPLLRGEIRAFRDRYPEAAEIRIVPNGSAEGMEQLVNSEVTMTVLTHPLQILLMGMIALHGVRAALSAVRQHRGDAASEPMPADLRIAA